MTIPMMPGWGDQLAQALPQLGMAIRNIVMPNRQYEVALRQALAADPTLASKLATIEKDNPGAIGQIYGANAGRFAGGLQESPDAQLRRQVTTNASGVASQRGNDVGAAALGIDSDVVSQGRQLSNEGQALENEGRGTQNELGKMNLDRTKLFMKFFGALPPELQNEAFFKETFGATSQEFTNAQNRAKNVADAAPLLQMGAPDIVKGFLSGKISTNQIQGWIDSNPDSANAILDLLKFDKEARLRTELAGIAAKDNRREFMQVAYLETMKDARKLGVNPAALFKYQTGFDANEVVPQFAGKPVTNEEVKAAEEAYTRHAQSERSKALRPALIALKAFESDPSTGSAAAATAALQSADLPIEIVWDTKGWNERKYYMTLDDGSRVELDSDDVAQAVSTGELPVPGSTTKTGDKKDSGGGLAETAKRIVGAAPLNKTTAEKMNQEPFKKLSDPSKKFALDIKNNGWTKEQVTSSSKFKSLPAEDQKNLISALGF